MLNRLLWLCLFLTGLLLMPVITFAQTSGDEPAAIQADLSLPQTEAFPRITLYLDVHDSQGHFLHGIKASQLRVFEDGISLPVADLQDLRQGVQLVVAVNPGKAFAIRDSQGLSRYDQLTGALRDWAGSRQGSTVDDLSLVTAGGPELIHTASVEDWLATLGGYGPDARSLNPNLDLLLRALEVATDPTPRPGMERVVLFITALPEGDLSFSVQNLISQAKQQNIHFLVWLVGSNLEQDSQPVEQLLSLAGETDGDFFAFSGTEDIPDLENFVEPLRDIYYLSYDSQISSGGAHQLEVEIQHEGGVIRSAGQNFDFDLQPPDPAFIASDLEVRREYPSGFGKTLVEKANLGALSPTNHTLQVLIDFPDGHPRPVVKATLFVDGKPVDENSEPPFDQFTWDLTGYNTSGQHLLRVEVVDSMGLTGSSMETPFQVLVASPGSNPLAFVFRYWPVISGLTVLLGGALILLALILGGRIHPYARSLPGSLSRRKKPNMAALKTGLRMDKRSRQEPGGQEVVPPEVNDGRLSGWVNRLHWPQRRLAPKAHAYLTQMVNPDPSANPNLPIPITSDEITIGRDTREATLVLDDLSVEGLHARLVRKENGSFWISDQGSVAGTWINYCLVPAEGAPVEHGDLLNIGRIGFRFTQRDPQHPRKPVVVFLEPPA